MKKLMFAFWATVLMYVGVACTPEQSNPSGADEPDGGKDKVVNVTGISLDRNSATIKEGESIVLVATVTPANANNKTVTWSSSSDAVATVDSGGKVTGIKAGSATITAATEDGGKKATCSISVEANLAPSVTIEAKNVSAISAVLAGKANLGSTVASDLKVGFQYSKSAGILPSNSTTIEATDADAAYNYTAVVIGLEPDKQYYFRSFVHQNNQYTYGETKPFTTKAMSTLLETWDASGVEATSATMNAKLDLTDIISESISYGFFWGTSESSMNSDFKCSEIKDNAISASLTNLSQATQYWYKAYVKLNNQSFYGEVKTFITGQLVTSISLNKTSITLNEGQEQTLIPTVNPSTATDKSLNWTSNNPSVATVDAEGKVIAVSKGTATIRVEANDGSGKYANCSVTVIRLVSSIYLDKTSITMYRGSSDVMETITAVVTPVDASNPSLSWTSSNTAVATVSNGVVTGKGPGVITITASAKDGSGIKSTCDVEVIQNVTNLSLNKTYISLYEEEEETLYVTIEPANSNDKTVSWTSSNPEVVTVVDGHITARTIGSSTITASVGSLSAECVVSVIPDGTVDLGLSVYWATCNLSEEGFVSSPEKYGDYYAWGETQTKEEYNWETYIWCNGTAKSLTKYNNKSSCGTVDNKFILESSDDVAHVKLGGKWRIPTVEEWEELLSNCTSTWVTNYNGTGVSGRLVKSKKNYSVLFLPTAGLLYNSTYYEVGRSGLYWSSSLNTDKPEQVWILYFYSEEFRKSGDGDRFDGFSVRPIMEK